MDHYKLILELNKLKLVFRNTTTATDRNESTAEHSWSAAMITILLMDKLREEFGPIDELRAIKLALIHDIVEIYAGDISAFDIQGRRDKEIVEREALVKLIAIAPDIGKQLYALWHEFEDRATIESKIAKASDAICPIFLRISTGQPYHPLNISLEHLNKIKRPTFEFSKTYTELFNQQLEDIVKLKLV